MAEPDWPRPARVYVDDAAMPHGSYLMYHMFSPNLDALHAMADRIGMPRRYFQDPIAMPRVSWPHYDVSHELRLLAVERGAIEVDRFQLVAMSGVITGKADPLSLFRSPYYRDQCTRLTLWLAEEGYPLQCPS